MEPPPTNIMDFPPIDTHDTQCSCRFVILDADKEKSSHVSNFWTCIYMPSTYRQISGACDTLMHVAFVARCWASSKLPVGT